MATWGKDKHGPIDRAVESLEQQIQTLEYQIRDLDTRGANSPAARAAEASAVQMKKFVTEMLTPPRPRVETSYRSQPELFDVPDNPMQDLEATPIAFGPSPNPDLFTEPPKSPDSDKKLAQYLSAGSFRMPKKELKHVARQNRQRFYMWVGLSMVALWVIYAIVR